MLVVQTPLESLRSKKEGVTKKVQKPEHAAATETIQEKKNANIA